MSTSYTKECIKCHEAKSLDEYKVGKYVRGACKACRSIQRKEMQDRYIKNAKDILKTCKQCKTEKDGTHFRYTLNICKACQSTTESESNNRKTADMLPTICSKCEIEQPAVNYRFRSKVCRKCEQAKLYEWREKNPEKFLGLCKKYRDKESSKEKRNTYKREKYLDDAVKFKQLYVTCIRTTLKAVNKKYNEGTLKGTEKYEYTLGCDFLTLHKWIEYNFENDMTWANFGKYWHLDHAIPCASFDMTKKDEQLLCFHWSNLHPMICIDNLKKSDKIDWKIINHVKSRAKEFIKLPDINIRIDALPEDIKGEESRVLDTKAYVKACAGVGEKPAVR
jgi:hypothetical protein